MKRLNRLMMAIFLGCLLLQLNDPDPVTWVVLYSVPLVGCLVWERFVWGRIFSGIAAVIAIVFAVMLVVSAPPASSEGWVFGQWEMMGEHAEVLREVGGLVLIAGWMTVLAFVGPKEK